MLKSEFKEGEQWAWRKSRVLGAPAERVSLLLAVQRGGTKVLRVRVRHEEGELKGLEEFAPPTNWYPAGPDWEKTHKRELRRAEYERRLRRSAAPDDTVLEGAGLVFTATGTGIEIWPYKDHPCDWVTKADLENLFPRIGWDLDARRHYDCLWISASEIWIPKKMAIDIAMAFAKAEPETVELYLAGREEWLLENSREPRVHGWKREELLRNLPAHALVRQWIGRDRETITLGMRVERLERLLLVAVNELRRAGLDKPAERIDAEMKKHLGSLVLRSRERGPVCLDGLTRSRP